MLSVMYNRNLFVRFFFLFNSFSVTIILQTMHAHSQFCMSGDNTLEATQHAISSLAKEDSDESIVVVLSDANLERYGIRPEKFAKVLTSNPDVNAYAIFIGSLGDQATRFCTDSLFIPHCIRNDSIFIRFNRSFVCICFFFICLFVFFRLIEKMPSGRAYVCMDLQKIPRILQQIFASSVLSTTRVN